MLLVIFSLFILALMTITTGCGSDTPDDGIDRGGTLRIASGDDLMSMDASFASGGLTNAIGFTVFGTIIKLGKDGDLQPELAESWSVAADSKSVTFNLRDDVNFHDGSKFDANAVKWNWDRILDDNVGSSLRSRLDAVQSVEVVDSSTVKINLKFPFRPFMSFLTELPGMIHSPDAVNKYNGYSDRNSDYGKNPVGAGAFEFGEWTVGNRITVTKNADYFVDGAPYLDEIVWQIIPDSNVRLSMVRTGESDIVEELRPQDIPLVESSDVGKVNIWDGGRSDNAGLRQPAGPYTNKDLRAAIASSIDREAYVDVMYDGHARPAYTFIQSGWAHDASLKPYTLDIAKAKQHLDAAGYDGSEMPIWCAGEDQQWCEVLQAMLGESGLKIGIVTLPPGENWSSFVEKGSHFNRLRWRPTADPHLNLRNIFGTGGGQNKQEYSSAAVDGALEIAAQEFDVAKAKPLYDDIQTQITTDASFVHLAYTKWITGLNKNVQNFQIVPDLDLRARDIWISSE